MPRAPLPILAALVLALNPAPLRADDPDAATPQARRATLVKIAHAMLAEAKAIEAPDSRDRAFQAAARLLARAGERDEARDAWRRALDAYQAIPVPPDGARDFNRSTGVLPLFALELARHDEPELARDAFRLAREEALRPESDAEKLARLQIVLIALHQAGFDDEARALLDEALAIVRESDDAQVRRFPEGQVAELRAAAGDYAGALRLVTEGEPPARVRPEVFRHMVLMAIGHALAFARGPDGDAAAVIDQALPLAYGFADLRERASLIATFAIAAANVGRLDRALEIAETIPDAVGDQADDDAIRRLKLGTLRQLATACLKAGRRDDAFALMDQAARIVESTPDRARDIDSDLRWVANFQAEAGDADAALRSASHSLPAARADMLLGVASTFEDSGRPDDARRAAEAARDAAEAVLRDPSILDLNPLRTRPAPDDARRAGAERAARSSLAYALDRLGQADAAEAALRDIPEGRDRDNARFRIDMARAFERDPDAALAYAQTLDPSRRIGFLSLYASHLQRRWGEPTDD
jgi:tetratricopeptide (TPR) repeat protein